MRKESKSIVQGGIPNDRDGTSANRYRQTLPGKQVINETSRAAARAEDREKQNPPNEPKGEKRQGPVPHTARVQTRTVQDWRVERGTLIQNH